MPKICLDHEHTWKITDIAVCSHPDCSASLVKKDAERLLNATEFIKPETVDKICTQLLESDNDNDKLIKILWIYKRLVSIGDS